MNIMGIKLNFEAKSAPESGIWTLTIKKGQNEKFD